MDMEMEGLDGDEAEEIKRMALHGSNIPDDTWSLPRGYDYDWSKPTFPRNPDLWKTAKTFLTEALDSSGTDVAEVDVPVRKRLCITIFGIPRHHNLQCYTRYFVKYGNGWNGKPVIKIPNLCH
jgi:hypothetical protein